MLDKDGKEVVEIPTPSPDGKGTESVLKVEDLQVKIAGLEKDLADRIKNYERLERKFTKTSQEKAQMEKDLEFVRSLTPEKTGETPDDFFGATEDKDKIEIKARLDKIEKDFQARNEEKEVASEQEKIGKFIDGVLSKPEIVKDFPYFDKELAINLLINPNRLNSLLNALQEDDEEEAEHIIREAARDSHLKIDKLMQDKKEGKKKLVSSAGEGGSPEIVPEKKKKFFEMTSQERADSIKGVLSKFTKK